MYLAKMAGLFGEKRHLFRHAPAYTPAIGQRDRIKH
jgi:hypothetical protein